MRSIEEGKNIENAEGLGAKIRLEFFRHDEKEKPVEDQADNTVRLTEKGRIHASEVGMGKEPKSDMSMAFGSARERSTETSLRQMLAREDIGGNATLEDIRSLISTEIGYGSKDRVTNNLNFNWSANPEFIKRYTETRDALKFLLDESDTLVKKLHDKETTSYSRQAGNIAEIIKKYIEILPRWQKLVDDYSDKYQEGNREMQRFLGSHQTVTESFLMKVIDKTEGREAVRAFIDNLKDKNGFGFSEGYKVEIKTKGGESIVLVQYGDKTWSLKPELINQIIAERDELNDQIEKQQ
ncbi:MAG: hypothetical protein V4509_03640 [Patescibacteria group bacterium]